MKLKRDDLKKTLETLEQACLEIHKDSPCSLFIPFDVKEETVGNDQFSMLLQEESSEGFTKSIKSGIIIGPKGINVGFVENPTTEIKLKDYIDTLASNTYLEENIEGLDGFLIRNHGILILTSDKRH